MRLLIMLSLCLLSSSALAQSRDTNSPDFDPVARMQRFFPGWQPPQVSQEELAKLPLGSAERPVRTQGPDGQEKYLSRLICKNGKPPSFKRSGSTMKGTYGYPTDIYEIKCGWSKPVIVHMDLYHPRYVENEAVPGFTIRE